MTYDVCQRAGASWSIALRLNKVARQPMPDFPMYFNIYKGNELIPELLSALKYNDKTDASSPSEICSWAAAARGMKASAGIFEARNIESLNLTKSAIYNAMSLDVLDFNMPQNCLGLCFSMFRS